MKLKEITMYDAVQKTAMGTNDIYIFPEEPAREEPKPKKAKSAFDWEDPEEPKKEKTPRKYAPIDEGKVKALREAGWSFPCRSIEDILKQCGKVFPQKTQLSLF